MSAKLAVGYQKPRNGEFFHEIVADHRESVGEVYFAWSNTPSGRPGTPLTDWEAQERLEYELGKLTELGVRLDLLLNANCYGAEAVSDHLARECRSVVAYLDSRGLRPGVITTTSPFLAGVMRREFPEIELRASVNMKLDSTLALEFLGDLFDSFYLRRDLQRDLETAARFRRWADAHGKKMGILANSGCLQSCPAQTFHDNLVAHQKEAYQRRNLPEGLTTFCMAHYQDPACFGDFLKSSWIRPEDLGLYDELADFVKIATRQHDSPRKVIASYARRKFSGDLASLMEPNFSTLFAKAGYVENDAFGAFDELPGACAAHCTHCGRCEELWKRVFRPFPPE